MEEHSELFTPEFSDILSSFLTDPARRLGRDVNVIKAHPLFKDIDWDNISEMKPLFVPNVRSSYFL
jgi:hypothetical protein